MKKELQKKLSKYAAAAAAVTTGIAGANAQVIYTDVDPDQTFDATENGGLTAVGLDIDNDMTFDYILASRDTVIGGTSPHVRFTLVAPYGTMSPNAIAGETPSAYDYALALDNGNMIDNTLNWINATNTMAYNVDSSNPYGENWNGVTDKYLGLQFQTGGSTYYGWARLDVQAIGDVFTIKDYAYNSTADAGIAAGDMGPANLDEAAIDQLVHFINQSNNTVLVKVNGNLTEGVVNVVSTAGQVVSTGMVDNGTFVVDMNGLESGIYMINVTFAEGSITKKMFVK
jgi:hypothetical protein